MPYNVIMSSSLQMLYQKDVNIKELDCIGVCVNKLELVSEACIIIYGYLGL